MNGHDDLWDGVWVAIPAYDEAATIRPLAEAARALCPRVIVVDDGSRDGTADRLAGLDVALLCHATNQGKGESLRTAFRHALAHDAACIVTLDGDGQHEPRDLPRLVAAWRRQPDRIVCGARLHDHAAMPALRYAANRIACFWISWAAGHAIADSQTGLRVYPRDVMAFAVDGGVASGGFAFESEILIEAARRGHETLAVEIAGLYPVGARGSHYRGAADTAAIVRMVAGRLLRRGMDLPGLVRSLRPARARATHTIDASSRVGTD